jgi:predicted enzyme related to lactoylglutathione lyase
VKRIVQDVRLSTPQPDGSAVFCGGQAAGAITGGHVQYKLFAVRVFVTDWQRAIRFYTETLGIPIAYRNDEIGWAQLATGEGQLALERVDPSDSESKELVGRFVGVSLAVPDILETHKALADRGVEFIAPPEKQPWGGVLAHLRDPDGNVITLLGGTK